MITGNPLFYAFVLMLSFILYKLISFLLYKRLTQKLKDGDFNTFIEELGEEYDYKFLTAGVRRCRWRKGITIVKASFYEDDSLKNSAIEPFNLFGFFNKIIFK